jgi:hypothetical protein
MRPTDILPLNKMNTMTVQGLMPNKYWLQAPFGTHASHKFILEKNDCQAGLMAWDARGGTDGMNAPTTYYFR